MTPLPTRGYDKFLELMLSSFDAASSTLLATHASELNAAMVNDIFDLPGPRHIERVADNDELIWSEVWYAFAEIHESYEALLDYEVYVRRYPYGGSRVSKVRHLLHAIEAYLHEAYILTERLKSFPGLVSKHLSGDAKERFSREVTSTMGKLVNKSFKNLTSARGRHTHNERFDSEEFKRLRILEVLLLAPKDLSWAKAVRVIFQSSYTDARKKWTKTVSDNNARTREFLDKYCDALHPFIFRDGKFRLYVKEGPKA